MKTAAIICEYNPFHNGHLYHIEETKRQTRADFIIALMSGNYVQRGTPAIMEKQLRTRFALECGADLVIELPLWFSTGSAPYFAEGAVRLLNGLGVVDFLSFGSECDDIRLLKKVCDFLQSHKNSLSIQTKKYHSMGHAYPRARELALLDLQPDPRFVPILREPNNILALEYLTALSKTRSSIQPHCVLRFGSQHHTDTLGEHVSSASSIRNHIEETGHLDSVLSQIPPICHPLMLEAFQTQFPVTIDDFSMLLKSNLLSGSPLEDFWEISSDFSDMITKHYTPTLSWTQLIQHCKNKNLTWSRISRNLLHIMLGMTQEHRKILLTHNFSLYFQILGFKKISTSLIAEINRKHTIPMVRHCRPQNDALLPYQETLLSVEQRANQYYQLILGEKYHISKKDQQIIV